MIDAASVDFIAVSISDLSLADRFYGQTLGLARNPNSGERFGGTIGLGVPDVAAARTTAEESGVEFDRDTFDSGVCHGAALNDPDGNPLLLHRRYAPLERFDVPVTEVERTDFIGVNVRDRGRAGDFYERTLGLRRNPLSSDEWPEFEAGNVGLILSTPDQKGRAGFRPEYTIAFRVPDVAGAMARLRERGVLFESPDVYDTGVCQMAFFSDPDGNALILHRRYAPYADGSRP